MAPDRRPETGGNDSGYSRSSPKGAARHLVGDAWQWRRTSLSMSKPIWSDPSSTGARMSRIGGASGLCQYSSDWITVHPRPRLQSTSPGLYLPFGVVAWNPFTAQHPLSLSCQLILTLMGIPRAVKLLRQFTAMAASVFWFGRVRDFRFGLIRVLVR